MLTRENFKYGVLSIANSKTGGKAKTQWQHSKECMCRLRNIAMRDYQESVTTGQTDGQKDAGQSDPYVPLCFAGDTIVPLCFEGNTKKDASLLSHAGKN